MFKRLFIVRKLNSENDPAVTTIVDAISSVAQGLNIPIVDDRSQIFGDTLVIAVGGDGTMLEAMRISALHDATALGVNLGRVGFLTEVNAKHRTGSRIDRFAFVKTMEQILRNPDQTTKRESRSVIVTSLHPSQISCNEVSITSNTSDTMISYHLQIDDVSAGVHRANSILVATSTGSTAYSLSAGGALMMPRLDAFQIVPVAPMTMTSRPIIVGTDSTIRIDVFGSGINVRSDGQLIDAVNTPSTKTHPYSIQLKTYLRKATVLHLRDWNFFNVLTEKLGWQQE